MHRISNYTIGHLLEEPGVAVIRVYLALLWGSEQIASTIRIGVRELAERAALSERSVFAALAQLESSGIIRRERREPGPAAGMFVIRDREADASDAADGNILKGNGGLNHQPAADIAERFATADSAALECSEERNEAHEAEIDNIDHEAAADEHGDQCVPSGIKNRLQRRAGCSQVQDKAGFDDPAIENIMIPTAGRPQDHHEAHCGDAVVQNILVPVASCYRRLNASETSVVAAFIDAFLEGDLRRFKAAVNSIEAGVSADASLDFFMAVVETADRSLRRPPGFLRW